MIDLWMSLITYRAIVTDTPKLAFLELTDDSDVANSWKYARESMNSSHLSLRFHCSRSKYRGAIPLRKCFELHNSLPSLLIEL